MKAILGDANAGTATARGTEMQVRSTFPQLNDGMSKSKRPHVKTKFAGIGGFGVSGKVKQVKAAPRTYAGRRAASHAKAYSD